MSRLRFTSCRAPYRRAGLVFDVATATRGADGRLSIVMAAEAVTAAQLTELRDDPSIEIVKVGPDGLTAAERHAAFRLRVMRNRTPAPIIAVPVRRQIPPAPATAEAARTAVSAILSESDQVRLARPPAPDGNGKTVGAQPVARSKAEGAEAPSATHSPKAAKAPKPVAPKAAVKPKGKRK